MIKICLCIIIILLVFIGCIITYIKRQISYCEETNNRYEELCDSHKELDRKYIALEKKMQQYNYFNTSLKIFRSNKARTIVENYVGDIYIVMESQNEDSVDFYFSGINHKGLCGCPRLLADIENDYIWINDIFAIDENVGNGSLLLSCLFEKANELGIKVIKGELAQVDKGHFDKLEHFYEKNGFDVSFNNECTHGVIVKTLD